MKKFVSLLMTVLMLATMLTVFVVPASASSSGVDLVLPDVEPEEGGEVEPINGIVHIFDKGDYTISRDLDLRRILIDNEGATLTIAEGKTVTVELEYYIKGTINLLGTLDISQCSEKYGIDRIIVGETGQLITGNAQGSTLSEGSLAIITGVAGLAVGFLVAMFIFKKKKPAVAGGKETEENSSEIKE